MRAIHENSKQWAWTSNKNQGPREAPAPSEKEAQGEYDPLFAVRWGAADHTHTLDFLDSLKPQEYDMPEKLLCRSVVLGAVQEYQGIGTVPGWGTPEKRRRIARFAEIWLFEEDSDREFSLPWCLGHLGIDVDYFRKGVRALGQPGLQESYNRYRKNNRNASAGQGTMRVQTEMRG